MRSRMRVTLNGLPLARSHAASAAARSSAARDAASHRSGLARSGSLPGFICIPRSPIALPMRPRMGSAGYEIVTGGAIAVTLVMRAGISGAAMEQAAEVVRIAKRIVIRLEREERYVAGEPVSLSQLVAACHARRIGLQKGGVMPSEIECRLRCRGSCGYGGSLWWNSGQSRE